MADDITAESVEALGQQILADTQRLAEMQRALVPESVRDYVLTTTSGDVKLSDLFVGKRDLLVIHNMGVKCSYCTMWADGINGIWQHLADRAGLVLISPDPPEVLEDFAKGRGWQFPVASAHGTTFNADLKMESENGADPGMSTFHRGEDGQIERVANSPFGPFDLFSPTWHFMARLKKGVDGWSPKFDYSND